MIVADDKTTFKSNEYKRRYSFFLFAHIAGAASSLVIWLLFLCNVDGSIGSRKCWSFLVSFLLNVPYSWVLHVTSTYIYGKPRHLGNHCHGYLITEICVAQVFLISVVAAVVYIVASALMTERAKNEYESVLYKWNDTWKTMADLRVTAVVSSIFLVWASCGLRMRGTKERHR